MRRNRRPTRSPSAAAASAPVNQTGWFRRHRYGILAAMTCCACACGVWAWSRAGAPPVYAIEVLNTFPHDQQAFTQGLTVADGVFYEGTGQYGRSTLRRVEIESGRVQQSHTLDRRLFGEGIAIWQDRIVQLTWQNRMGIVYDKTTFRELQRFPYRGEGWGLTHDDTHLIMSDGSSTLRFLDPQSYQVVRQVSVTSQGRPVSHLNELEYVHGEVLANIWYKDYIARISPSTGEVLGWIDCRGLYRSRASRDEVLNGIAYDPTGERLFVTGKNWPKIFQIRVTRPSS